MATVVITGANRGIGRELAQLYAAAGHDLLLGVRQPDGAPTLPGEILPLDVADDGSVTAFADALRDRTVDILINNAGVIGPDRQSTLDTDFAGFLHTLNVNTLGPLRVTQALLPALRRAGGAKVAIISSFMGSLSYASSDRIAYRASKAAVNKVAQGLATDLSREGIAVASVHPGWVRTEMGGPAADIAPQESAAGIKAVIDRLSLATSGQFHNYDGAILDW
ncbi:SDR family oxidoreductase [Sphingobium sufflavum]|uniref:SDR family oxidoreductase n=1 Tax=Sphingobium sufflavum TaxID=1129547 RepID=UPI001F43A5A6|nr:SDR family oxidoreductase [Sphingobium sufflavum]MCE7797288.1 SDR family oxidoreductase [Sphingobium sufflavum]